MINETVYILLYELSLQNLVCILHYGKSLFRLAAFQELSSHVQLVAALLDSIGLHPFCSKCGPETTPSASPDSLVKLLNRGPFHSIRICIFTSSSSDRYLQD